MAASIPENAYIVNLTDSYGSMLVGCFLSCIVWGISCLQTFLYFAMYESDRWTQKTLIACLWVVDTVNQIVVLKSMWPVLIKHYGSIHGLSQIQPELTHHAWIALHRWQQLLECSVQFFFMYRIYLFSGKRWLFPAVMGVLSIYQLFCLIPYDVIVFSVGSSSSALATRKATAILMSLRAVTAAEDIILSATLIYLVLRKGLPEFHRSKRMAVRLLVVTVNTGFWTAVVALVELCLVAKYPTGLQFTIVEFPLCSLYFSTLLANLNARDYVKGSSDTLWNETPSHLMGSGRTGNNSGTLYLGSLRSDRSTQQDREGVPSLTKIAGIADAEEINYRKNMVQASTLL
ncbi:hypothetical protein EW146_g9943 [Bondarzewia mesenterica]|uniref:DUF6534 domain-containing protein n=1 Tax=Bondarzewia mesenterica TaxID=1095465 RepID=A0A4S4L1U6_9AGAM|nr:hypothetical protein EW146_g9943 [Bondarzewia mesenterica]